MSSDGASAVSGRSRDAAGRSKQTAIAWHIEAPGIILRCFTPRDAPALVEAVTRSLASLRPWMPWAQHEPSTVEQKAQLLSRWHVSFCEGRDLHYGIFDALQTECLGAIGMHARVGAGARELGYWIRADRQGQGIATKAVMMLTRVGFERMRLRRLEIHCDPRNSASSAVARRAGYELQVEIKNVMRGRRATQRVGQLWRMSKASYPLSPASQAALRALDDRGSIILDGSRMI